MATMNELRSATVLRTVSALVSYKYMQYSDAPSQIPLSHAGSVSTMSTLHAKNGPYLQRLTLPHI